MHTGPTRDRLIESMDSLHAGISASQSRLFELIADADRGEVWRDFGARDLVHFLSIRYGISCWKAHRWVAAAHALEDLPRLSEAFRSGELGIDKVVELARFATADTEARLVSWAKGVSVGCVRRRADLACRPSIQDAQDAERARSLSWWYLDEGRRLGLEAEPPAADGAVVARAIERLAAELPVMPGEDDASFALARRAHALVALCSGAVGEAGRPTVVVHVPVDALLAGVPSCEIEGGSVIHPETARRLLCTARVQAVIEDDDRNAVGLGRLSREPSASMMRQLRYRDRECRFPGCGARRFTQAHHIVWWRNGGRTDLRNLLLICTFHHKLVHEHRWVVRREKDGTIRWFHPDGRRYRAGPAPTRATFEPQPALAAVG